MFASLLCGEMIMTFICVLIFRKKETAKSVIDKHSELNLTPTSSATELASPTSELTSLLSKYQ